MFAYVVISPWQINQAGLGSQFAGKRKFQSKLVRSRPKSCFGAAECDSRAGG
jgi:hypothetical protein